MLGTQRLAHDGVPREPLVERRGQLRERRRAPGRPLRRHARRPLRGARLLRRAAGPQPQLAQRGHQHAAEHEQGEADLVRAIAHAGPVGRQEDERLDRDDERRREQARQQAPHDGGDDDGQVGDDEPDVAAEVVVEPGLGQLGDDREHDGETERDGAGHRRQGRTSGSGAGAGPTTARRSVSQGRPAAARAGSPAPIRAREVGARPAGPARRAGSSRRRGVREAAHLARGAVEPLHGAGVLRRPGRVEHGGELGEPDPLQRLVQDRRRPDTPTCEHHGTTRSE